MVFCALPCVTFISIWPPHSTPCPIASVNSGATIWGHSHKIPIVHHKCVSVWSKKKYITYVTSIEYMNNQNVFVQYRRSTTGSFQPHRNTKIHDIYYDLEKVNQTSLQIEITQTTEFCNEHFKIKFQSKIWPGTQLQSLSCQLQMLFDRWLWTHCQWKVLNNSAVAQFGFQKPSQILSASWMRKTNRRPV